MQPKKRRRPSCSSLSFLAYNVFGPEGCKTYGRAYGPEFYSTAARTSLINEQLIAARPDFIALSEVDPVCDAHERGLKEAGYTLIGETPFMLKLFRGQTAWRTQLFMREGVAVPDPDVGPLVVAGGACVLRRLRHRDSGRTIVVGAVHALPGMDSERTLSGRYEAAEYFTKQLGLQAKFFGATTPRAVRLLQMQAIVLGFQELTKSPGDPLGNDCAAVAFGDFNLRPEDELTAALDEGRIFSGGVECRYGGRMSATLSTAQWFEAPGAESMATYPCRDTEERDYVLRSDRVYARGKGVQPTFIEVLPFECRGPRGDRFPQFLSDHSAVRVDIEIEF